MKEQDQFTDWLRDKLLNNPAEPPAGAWQQISESLDMEEAWDNIGEELDVDSVWQKVDKRLHRYEHLQFFERISYGLTALAAIPLLLVIFWLENSEIHRSSSPNYAVTETSSSKDSDLPLTAAPTGVPTVKTKPKLTTGEAIRKAFHGHDNNISTSGKQEGKSSNPIASNAFSGLQSAKKGIPAGNEEQEKGLLLAKQKEMRKQKPAHQPVQLLEPRGFIFGEPSGAGLDIQRQVIVEQEFNNSGESTLPKITVGLGSAAKISWLVNNKTLDAFGRESLTTAVPAVYTDLFLLSGFRISHNLTLQADLYLFDWSGQQYKEYREGTYGQFKNKLLYRSLGVSAIKQGTRIGYGANPLFMYYQAGFYGGWLQNAKEYAMDGTTNRTDEFSHTHFGLQLGYGYDWYVLENLAVSYGLRARLDLFNVYSGTSAIPANFRRTRNASLDFNLSLKYSIRK